MRRLEQAIEALRADPPELVRGDYVEALPEVLAAQPSDGLTVVFQTASFGYIGDEGRARVRAVLEEAGEERQLAFISSGKPRAPEEHCWGLRLVYWPGGEREFAGHADIHGSWLQWELVITSSSNPKLRLGPPPARVAAPAREGGIFRRRRRGSRAGGRRCGHRPGRAAASGRGRRAGAPGEGLDDGPPAESDGHLPARCVAAGSRARLARALARGGSGEPGDDPADRRCIRRFGRPLAGLR